MRSLFLPIALVLLAGAAGRGRRVRGGAAGPPGAEAGAVRVGGGGPGVRAAGQLLETSLEPCPAFFEHKAFTKCTAADS
ncbi:hypothetical protein C2845_PM16G07190 [Panicum miliaceum]|uniref:Uncharacterized protein n=1 Tax=Panicum miliaceum TaxID=4540 RepID=A0A3L6PYK4_PANMI|nr:hypothetical protein C2845_PM16G07190 [Panicum miliaceum]